MLEAHKETSHIPLYIAALGTVPSSVHVVCRLDETQTRSRLSFHLLIGSLSGVTTLCLAASGEERCPPLIPSLEPCLCMSSPPRWTWCPRYRELLPFRMRALPQRHRAQNASCCTIHDALTWSGLGIAMSLVIYMAETQLAPAHLRSAGSRAQ